LKDYVKIYTTDNKYTLTLISLIKLENLLSSKGFSRIHRSYIINIKHVKSIQKNKVIIAEKESQSVKVIKIISLKKSIYNIPKVVITLL
jgi:DNA-binding LytR/AlgR family response regulator